MKTIMVILFAFLSLAVSSQQMSINDIISKFEGKEGVTTVVLSKDMMELASNVKSDNADFGNFIKSISGIKILVLEHSSQSQRDSFATMVKMLPVSDYKDLMTVKEGNKLIKMVVKENKGKISDFLLLVTGDKEPVLINITGNIDMKKLSSAGKNMNMTGFEYLARLDKKSK
jgi:hypothetical protein